MRQRFARTDRGVSLPELMIVMIVMGVLGAIVISAVIWGNRTTTTQTRNADLWADVQDASTQLIRDVNDASQITVADPNKMTALLVRDGKCQERAWVADTVAKRLTVTTTFYEQTECKGPTSTRVVRVIGNNAVGNNTVGASPTRYLSATTFGFYDTLADTPLPAPVEVDRVTRVGWTLVAQADDGYRQQTITSGAAFNGTGAIATGTGNVVNATTPLLCPSLRLTGQVGACTAAPVAAAAGKLEGRDAPVLQWVDTSPPGLTQGWSIYRVANPEGTSDGDPGRTTWVQVGYVVDPAQTWFVDSTQPAGLAALPGAGAGYTAQYVVRATIPSGVGPSSNQVITGLRPTTAVVTATGAPTSIALAWGDVVGATGYDVFRDGSLAASLPDVQTWTDALSYGHSHFYQVVAVNRWENRLINASGLDTQRLALGSSITTAYPGGPRMISAQVGAYTAPATPSLSVAPQSDWSNTVSRGLAGWTGAGPTTVFGNIRDRGWETQQHPTGGGWSDLWAGGGELAGSTSAGSHTGRPAGTFTFYQIRTCNAVGCSPWSAQASALQRPAAPSCSISGVTTRSMTVTVNPVSMPETGYTSFDINGGTGSPTGVSPQGGTSFFVDQLTHNSADTFTPTSQNASPANGGWSDVGGACGASTLLLAVGVNAPSSVTTRSVTASGWVTNGNSSSLTLDGIRTNPGVGSTTFDPLRHNTGFTLTARNSDGWNNVVATRGVTTVLLSTPSISVGAVTTRSITAWASITNGTPDSLTLEGVRTNPGLGVTTFDPLTDNIGYTLTARNTDGYNGTASTRGVSTVRLLNPTIRIWGVTTRGASSAASCGNGGGYPGSNCTSSIAGGGWTRNDLRDDTTYTVTALNTDGRNTVGSSATFKTAYLRAFAPSCSIFGGGTQPNGWVTINAWGGSGAGYGYSPAKFRTGLGSGWYSDGSVRAMASDGLNTQWSSYTACSGSVYVAYPKPTVPSVSAAFAANNCTSPASWSWGIVFSSRYATSYRWTFSANGVSFSGSGNNAGGSVNGGYSGGRGSYSVTASGPGGSTSTSGSVNMGPSGYCAG